MNKVNLRKNEENSQGIAVKSFESLFSFMDTSDEPWDIKDTESRHVYANKAALDFWDLPVGYNVEGRLDSECPAPWAEFAPEFQEQDRKTEENKKGVAIISTQIYTREKKLLSYFVPKYPIYNEFQECIGTIHTASRLDCLLVSQTFSRCVPSTLVLDPPTDLFTKPELKVMFYALQSMNAEEIGRKLDHPQQAIKDNLRRIYKKAKVNSSAMFKEFCCAEGFDRYMPPELIKPEVQFISL
ncbi:LuxR family transcriptional regulator [Candidatus Fukatsuia endosymbiont of Tuberolachnus salignus]|uniref:helix-turn-helix transcriptional regulator n=1 Tax=Candidatus Fukatsuia endosymbiont of Tuberolachnus salignus TaxID=3077957 RepID=UPI00313CE762